MMTETTPEATNPDEYNGWPNRETWAASLHLSNDHGLYLKVNGWARDARFEAIKNAETDEFGLHAAGVMPNIETATVHILADKLRDYIDTLRADITDAARHPGYVPSETETMMVLEIGSDWRVDWSDVARSWLDGFDFED